jgi:deazaflavin-dependent oxidoreductase (nitroreductase family)
VSVTECQIGSRLADAASTPGPAPIDGSGVDALQSVSAQVSSWPNRTRGATSLKPAHVTTLVDNAARDPMSAGSRCGRRVRYRRGLRFRVREREEVVVGRWLVRLVAGAVVALAVVVTVFLVGMRTRSPAVVDGVRRFNRAVTNPRVLRSAGSPGASASVIRHRGRVSGRVYETPVGPFAVGDGFVIALPYGPDADWVRNVLAHGSATLVHEGHTEPVHQPEVVATAEVVRKLPSSQQRTLRLFGVDQCLRLRTAPGD